MGLHLFFLPNFPGAMFIQGATFIPDSRVKNSQRILQKLPKNSKKNFQKIPNKFPKNSDSC